MSHESERPILHQISDLVAEERELRSTHTGIGLNSAERSRLDAIERELDRCWDMLRHRRAEEEYGTDASRDSDDSDAMSDSGRSGRSEDSDFNDGWRS
ncbi:MAG TPA: DUF2630 family protein [Jatrophihabitans sp.]|jgi:nitric oxide reductase activation protein|uniref:DUF2630 family protein n=1 Tax=Jatrophihabitans sp. TaxID=1932789 RepID=UPI002EE9DD6B